MFRLSVKKIFTSLFLFLASLFSLLCLVFTLQGVNTTKNGATYKFAENGFDLFDGASDFILDSAYYPGATAMQVVNIIILAVGIISILCAIFAIIKQNKNIALAVRISALTVGLLYMTEGIVFTAINSATNDFLSGFYTLSYIPFILIVIFEIGYRISDVYCSDQPLMASVANYGVDRSVKTAAKDHCTLSSYSDLKEIKELFDAGILSEAEYLEHKALILNAIKEQRYY